MFCGARRLSENFSHRCKTNFSIFTCRQQKAALGAVRVVCFCNCVRAEQKPLCAVRAALFLLSSSARDSAAAFVFFLRLVFHVA
jgi:hypothetical protein